MGLPLHVSGTDTIILERSIEVIRDQYGSPHGVPSGTTMYYSNEEEGDVVHVELKPGKYCNECFFGDPEEGLGGTVQCLKQGRKKCKPGKTVYKEVHSLPVVTNADKIRAKSDEQLATDYAALTFWTDETGMPYYSGPEEDDGHLNFDEAYNKWLQWLKQEAKEEE